MSNYAYNPITGQLDLVGAGGGTSYIDGDVEYHSNLPVTVGSPAVNSAFLVRKGEGLYFISRKPAGIWVRELNNGNLDDWKYAGTFSDLYRDANFRILNNADVSKELAFDLSGITTGTVRTLTAPDASGRIQIEGQPIGNTTPAAGAFTTLNVTTAGTNASPSLNLGSNSGLYDGTTTALRLAVNGAQLVSFFGGGASNRGIVIRDDTGEFQIGGASIDVRLGRDASNTLSLKNTTNAQTFNIYNTHTSATNHERGFLKWSSNVFQIGTEKGSGGGTARALEFQTDGTTRFSIAATAAVLNVGGGSFDAVIGRPNAGVIGFARADGATTYIAAMGFDGTNRALVMNSGAFLSWSNGNATAVGGDLRMFRSGAGILRLQSDTSDFNRIQFGGTTTSFPALKRDSTVLQARLANDSDFCPLQGQLRIHQNAVAETPTATHTMTLFDAAGTAYKVLCVAA